MSNDTRYPDYGEALQRAAQRIHEEIQVAESANNTPIFVDKDGVFSVVPTVPTATPTSYTDGLQRANEIIHQEYDEARKKVEYLAVMSGNER